MGQADNATATTSFTDFFTADGHQTTLTLDCVGPAKILKCKQGFLPPDGSKTLTVSKALPIFRRIYRLT